MKNYFLKNVLYFTVKFVLKILNFTNCKIAVKLHT